MSNGYNPDFDKNLFKEDLKFGEGKENEVYNMLMGKGKLEIKADRMVFQTGNICLEIGYKGKPSGVTGTKADWFIVSATHDGKTLGGWFFDVQTLRRNLEKLRGEFRVVKGGDNNDSILVLVPMEKIHLLLLP